MLVLHICYYHRCFSLGCMRAAQAPPPCYTCQGGVWVWNCSSGQICCGGSCCSNTCCNGSSCCSNTCCNGICCGTCYQCVSGGCVACKCWDTGTPITGSITVQSAILCGQKTHTSSVSDTDHWFLGGDGHGYPADSLTYSWSKAPGTNCQTGTWTTGTTSSSVGWRAPPCTGTVIIKLTVNDKPDSMDDPCPGSSRDDSSKNFQGTSSVSLPAGCSNSGPHDSSVHWINPDDDYSSSTEPSLPRVGLFNNMYATTKDVDFKYQNCTWVCEISNVIAKDRILVAPHFPYCRTMFR